MKKILLISMTLLVLASGGVASTMCTTDIGLDQYIVNYTGINNACQIGDKLFYDFGFSSSLAPTGTPPSAAGVSIAPVPGDGFSNPGILFSVGGFLIFPGKTLDATITYSVATLSGSAVIEDYSLDIAGSHSSQPTGLGFGTVTESFSGSPAGTPLVTSVGPLAANTLSAETNILPWVSSTTVTTQIHLQSPIDGGDRVTISAIEEHFSEAVPEPYQPILIGSGLLFFGLWRKRVRHSNNNG
jgi:hypothetical protein